MVGLFVAIGVVFGGGIAAVLLVSSHLSHTSERPSTSDGRPGTNPHQGFVSAKLELEPLPGVLLNSPEGALDRPRDLRVTRLSDATLDSARPRLGQLGLHPAAGIYFDAGMTADDRFRRPVTISLDLEQIGINPWLRSRVGLVKEEDGSFVRVASRSDGGRLIFSTTHNGPVFIVVGLSTIVALTRYQHEIRRSLGIEGDLDVLPDGFEWYGVLSSSGRFNVMWPAGRHKESSEAKRVLAQLERYSKEYNEAVRTGHVPPPAPGVPAAHRDLTSYMRVLEGEIDRLARVVNDAEWQREHWALPEGRLVAELLDEAHVYLTLRGFNPPPYVVNVFLWDPWPHSAELMGLVQNRFGRSPWLSLALGAAPVMGQGDSLWSKEGADLMVTLVHELFHVFQTSYGTGELRDRNLVWIGEATALTLERELWEAFGSRLGNRGWYERALTTRDQHWHVYRGPMEPVGTRGVGGLIGHDDTALIHHGYGYSHFFEYMRDKAFTPDTRSSFLLLFYDNLNRTGSAPAALERIAEQRTGESLSRHYADFVIEHANEIALSLGDGGDEERRVSTERRHLSWSWSDVPPLSSKIHRVVIPTSVVGYDKATVVYRAEDKPTTVRLRYRGLIAREWTELSKTRAVIPRMPVTSPRLGRRDGLLLQAIGVYSMTDAPPSRGRFTLTVLLPPEAPPELPQGPVLDLETIEGSQASGLHVRWKRSTLAGEQSYRDVHLGRRTGRASRAMRQAPRPDHEARFGLEGFQYEIEIETWTDARLIQSRRSLVDLEHTDLFVPWKELLGDGTTDISELRVRVRETLRVGSEIVRGEPSPDAVITLRSRGCGATGVSVYLGGSLYDLEAGGPTTLQFPRGHRIFTAGLYVVVVLEQACDISGLEAVIDYGDGSTRKFPLSGWRKDEATGRWLLFPDVSSSGSFQQTQPRKISTEYHVVGDGMRLTWRVQVRDGSGRVLASNRHDIVVREHVSGPISPPTGN